MMALTLGVADAQPVLNSVKEGASKAGKAVGDTVGGAASAVGGAIESTTEGLRDEATPEETRLKLDAMAEQTLARLFSEQPDSQTLFDRSAGYAVFDAREASFYVAAGYGRGVAVNKKTKARTYMKMTTVGAGLGIGIGGFERQLVILFENTAELQKFVTQGFDATAGVDAMAGDEKDQLALRFTEGKAVFLLTKKGWKIAAKLTGSRYRPDETLNTQ